MKKCLVLDLDNTLWGGIVGEDGIDTLSLSLDAPGNSYIAFQQAILDHYNRGILLAINSRNNPEDAWNVIRNHPNMILKEHHFAASRINWNDKATNIRDIAKELNIGLDSIVFIDDDITNRELVKALVPEVETPDLPNDPKEYTKFLHSLTYFNTDVITDEDKMRGNLYVTERLRKEQEKKFQSKEEFLKSLNLELTVHKDDAYVIPRLSQLTEKTNQFNTNKQVLDEQQLQEYIVSNSHRVFYGHLLDVFGDYGVICFALVDIQKDTWNIRLMLMSCRVFGREVEDAFLSEIIKQAHKEGALEITIDYTESDKNLPAKEFIQKNFTNRRLHVTLSPYQPSWIRIHSK